MNRPKPVLKCTTWWNQHIAAIILKLKEKETVEKSTRDKLGVEMVRQMNEWNAILLTNRSTGYNQTFISDDLCEK
jgi:hypothetical protein